MLARPARPPAPRPRYRRRLHSTAAGFANTVWIDDDGFDLAWHVRPATLRAPGDDDALAAPVGREMSRCLDRSRPLWELTVIDRLDDGRRALLAKMHHALVDAVAAVDIGTVLLDPTPEPLHTRCPRSPGSRAQEPLPDAGAHLALLHLSKRQLRLGG